MHTEIQGDLAADSFSLASNELLDPGAIKDFVVRR